MKTNDNLSNSNEGCIPSDVLLKYVKGELSGEERNRVEKHLASCEMCSDELEGLSSLENTDSINNIVSELNSNVDEIVEGKKKIVPAWNTYLKIAASIILLLGVSSLIYFAAFRNTPSTMMSSNIGFEIAKPSAIMDSFRTLDKKEVEGVKVKTNQLFAKSEESRRNTKTAKPKIESKEEEVKYDSPVVVDSVSVNEKPSMEVVVSDVSDSVLPERIEVAMEEMVVTASAAAKVENTENKKMLSQKNAPSTDISQKIVIRGVSSNSHISTQTYNSTMIQAINLYNVGNYKKALLFLIVNQLSSKSPESDTSQFYTSMCHYRLGRIDSAIVVFEKLLVHRQSVYYNEGKWYYALSLLKSRNKDNAIKVLNEIIAEESTYLDSARTALDRFKVNE